MILSWMLYVCATALFLGLAAAILETVVRERGWPVRGLWAGALIGSFVIPFMAPFGSPWGDAPPAPARESFGSDQSLIPPVQNSWDAALAVQNRITPFDPDPWLVGLWMSTTVLLSVALVVSHAILRRRQRSWDFREVDGREVWISQDVGPAVVGFFHNRIVLPEWLLDCNEKERALVLSHEEEHVRAGDPRLLFGARLMVVAFPWNAALWWQYRRLRQAVEVDCDRRVLRLGLDPRAYSRLLVFVSEYGQAHRFVTAALYETPSTLEKRIRHMLMPQRRHWGPRALGAALLGSALIAAACRVDSPEHSLNPAHQSGEELKISQEMSSEAAVLVSPSLASVEFALPKRETWRWYSADTPVDASEYEWQVYIGENEATLHAIGYLLFKHSEDAPRTGSFAQLLSSGQVQLSIVREGRARLHGAAVHAQVVNERLRFQLYDEAAIREVFGARPRTVTVSVRVPGEPQERFEVPVQYRGL
jgi:hypothetical protein